MLLRLGGQDLAMPRRARVYICGITPYDTTHVGHAATFVWSDVVVRFLGLLGHEVRVARNITDVDDELLARARRHDVPWRSLATQQTYRFEDDMAALGVSTPTFEPQAHNYIDEVIQLAQALLDLGHAYEEQGSVYSTHPGIHERAGLTRDEAEAVAAERGGHPEDPLKRDPLDSVVWQCAGDDDGPAWASPWGQGRPGWHAECAAMALSTLGPGIDVHCGGADLAFPHHAVEAALAEAATGVTPFSRSWLRAGTVHHQGEKMAKSTGNLVLLAQLLHHCSPAALRLLICDRRWWDEWEFDLDAIGPAEERVTALRAAARTNGSKAGHLRVVEALADDLDVPTALAEAGHDGGAAAAAMLEVLGLHHAEPTARSTLLPSP
jgi:cysteinyl-tRNA synthetase